MLIALILGFTAGWLAAWSVSRRRASQRDERIHSLQASLRARDVRLLDLRARLRKREMELDSLQVDSVLGDGGAAGRIGTLAEGAEGVLGRD